ncbi:MAG: Flp pilus assembly complex ATPase component TadA [Phycisphaeraceae bacterium]|nr:Flp pilus assembly complex ATPase component TadA [Phycisphaeraceae bacterium]
MLARDHASAGLPSDVLAASSSMSNMFYLIFQTPGGTRQVGLTAQPFTIGRGSGNALVIDEGQASRTHCVIEPAMETGGFQLRDLGSRNGTKLNGQFVALALLQPGDVIQIGRFSVRFSDAPATLSNGARAASPPPFADPALKPDAPTRSATSPGMALPGVPGFLKKKPPAPAPSPDPDDTLTDDDAIPLAPHQVVTSRKVPEGRIIQAAAEDEKTLRMLAQSLPNQQFPETAISLVNARGQTVHAGDPRTLTSAGPDGAAAASVAETVRLLRLLLLVCFRSRATDLHVEPKETRFEIRVRVDGMMVRVMNLHKDSGLKLMSLVKILGDIDIAQKAVVQEGHFTTAVPGRRVDYRISFTPAMNGQKLVVRVLDLANAPSHLRDLDLPQWMFEEARRLIHQDAGMVLMCGPTGSGKTTTLYAMIREIDVHQRNVITIEDPVEYRIDGVTQIPVNDSKGNSFSNLLRSVLRQDPDVLLVGEVRDAETAKIAMQAAMTGHLVFSTVHAQNTIGSIYRLMDLGVDGYLVASALHLVVAQRLVRLLCPHCKLLRKAQPSEQMRMAKAVQELNQLPQAVGCPRCLETGFHGRKAVFELLTATAEIRDVILAGGAVQALRKAMANTLFTSLLENAYKLVAEGLTTLEEVERVIGTES